MKYETLRDIGNEFGFSGTNSPNFHRWVKKNCPETTLVKIRDPHGSGKEVNAVTSEDADKIRQKYENWKGGGLSRKLKLDTPIHGVFYAIRLLPNLRPTRIKFGHAVDLERRFGEHKCTCPNAEIIHSWSCLKRNEHDVLGLISRSEGVQQIGGEVFECDSFEKVFKKIEDFLLCYTGTKVSSLNPWRLSERLSFFLRFFVRHCSTPSVYDR